MSETPTTSGPASGGDGLHGDYRGRYIVIGPPGTGKTTFIARQVRAVVERRRAFTIGDNTPVVVCSLTRTAAAEAAGRDLPVPKQAVGTLHAHAYRALGFPKIAAGSELADWNREHPTLALSGAADDVDDLGTADDHSGDQPGDQFHQHYQLLRNRCVNPEAWPATVRAFAEKWEAWKERKELWDFTDLIDSAIEHTDNAPGDPRVVMVDEAQDMSALEYRLASKWGDAAGATIVVGDPWQSLYEWRGAFPGLFNDPDVPLSRRRVLKQSYRVPKSVLDFAVAWVSRLSDYQPTEYHARLDPDTEDPVDGEVLLCNNATWRSPTQIIELAKKDLASGMSVMVCASCGYMIYPLVAELRKHGMAYANPWRRSRGDWNPLAPRRGVSSSDRLLSLLRPVRAVWGDQARWWTVGDVHRFASVMRAKGLFGYSGKSKLEKDAASNPDEELTMEVWDRYFVPHVFETLLDLIGKADSGDVSKCEELIGWYRDGLTAQYQDGVVYPVSVLTGSGPSALMSEPRLFVGTVHSFKGAEADSVYLFPDVSPSAYHDFGRGGPLADPVIRTFYVGATRARHKLTIVRGATSGLCAPLPHIAKAAGVVRDVIGSPAGDEVPI